MHKRTLSGWMGPKLGPWSERIAEVQMHVLEAGFFRKFYERALRATKHAEGLRKNIFLWGIFFFIFCLGRLGFEQYVDESRRRKLEDLFGKEAQKIRRVQFSPRIYSPTRAKLFFVSQVPRPPPHLGHADDRAVLHRSDRLGLRRRDLEQGLVRDPGGQRASNIGRHPGSRQIISCFGLRCRQEDFCLNLRISPPKTSTSSTLCTNVFPLPTLSL